MWMKHIRRTILWRKFLEGLKVELAIFRETKNLLNPFYLRVKYVGGPLKYIKFHFYSFKIFYSNNGIPKKFHPHFFS